MKKFMMIIGIALIVLGMMSLPFPVLRQWVPEIICFGLIIFVSLFVLSGLKRVPQEQRWLIERFGEYSRTLKPGLRWVWPFIEKVRTYVSVWEQRYPLFKKPNKIDFTDGSATPKEAFVFVQCNEEDPDAPQKMVYNIKDVQAATVALIENTVRSGLNRKTVDEALKAGHDILSIISSENKDGIVEQAKAWGLRINRVTIGDFDLDPAIIKAREAVIKAKNLFLAAQQEKRTRAQETMGALVQMIAEAEGVQPSAIQEEIQKDKKLKKKILEISQDLIHRRMAIDGKSFVDIRVSGAEGIEKMLLSAIALWRGTASPRKEGKAGKAPGKPAREEDD